MHCSENYNIYLAFLSCTKIWPLCPTLVRICCLLPHEAHDIVDLVQNHVLGNVLIIDFGVGGQGNTIKGSFALRDETM